VKDYVDDGSALERIVFDVFTSEDEPNITVARINVNVELS
jgi:hypothetical protein